MPTSLWPSCQAAGHGARWPLRDTCCPLAVGWAGQTCAQNSSYHDKLAVAWSLFHSFQLMTPAVALDSPRAEGEVVGRPAVSLSTFRRCSCLPLPCSGTGCCDVLAWPQGVTPAPGTQKVSCQLPVATSAAYCEGVSLGKPHCHGRQDGYLCQGQVNASRTAQGPCGSVSQGWGGGVCPWGSPLGSSEKS